MELLKNAQHNLSNCHRDELIYQIGMGQLSDAVRLLEAGHTLSADVGPLLPKTTCGDLRNVIETIKAN